MLQEKRNMVFLFCMACVVSFALIDSQQSLAYDVGIRLDKTCLKLIESGDYFTCPTYQEIEKFFPNIKLNQQYHDIIFSSNDTITTISNNHTLELYSKQCILYNQCNIFQPNTTHYWHNPSEFLSRSLDVITITPNMKIKNPVHLKYNDTVILTGNNTRLIHFEINQLYISENCKDAVFSPNYDWQYELGHLIYYMSDNCTNSKLLNNVFDLSHTEKTGITKYDPRTSPNYNYSIWLESTKEACKQKC